MTAPALRIALCQSAVSGRWEPVEELLDRNTPVFGLSTRQIGDRVRATTQAAALSAGLTGHSDRVVMAQDLLKSGAELPTFMTASRWRSFTIPARYTERQAAAGGTKYY